MSYQSTIKSLKDKGVDVNRVQWMLKSVKQYGPHSSYTYKDIKEALKDLEENQ